MTDARANCIFVFKSETSLNLVLGGMRTHKVIDR